MASGLVGQLIEPFKTISFRSLIEGRLIGPLLLVCFTNDMPSVVKYLVHLFADDTRLNRHITNIQEQQASKAVLASLEDWGEKWKLRFNTDKM